jgi:predicted transcriptional regulator
MKMRKIKVDRPKNLAECQEIIQNGFKNTNNLQIDMGLGIVYDCLVDYILNNKFTPLIKLARILNEVIVTNKKKKANDSFNSSYYLGEIKALLTVSDYISQLTIPEEIVQSINNSKYNKRILRVLFNGDSMPASDLCTHIGLPHRSQLHRLTTTLVKEGILRRDKWGKYVWYSLTSKGKQIAEKFTSSYESEVVELSSNFLVLLNKILSKLKSGISVTDTSIVDYDEKIMIPGTQKRQLLNKILDLLKQYHVIEENKGLFTLIQPKKPVSISDYINNLLPNMSPMELLSNYYRYLPRKTITIADTNIYQLYILIDITKFADYQTIHTLQSSSKMLESLTIGRSRIYSLK